MAQAQLARRTREELQLLAVREVLRASASLLPLEEILAVIANMAIIAFDARTSWIMLEQDGVLHTVLSRGEQAEALKGLACGGDMSVACRVAREEHPLTLPPGQLDPADPVLGALAGDEAVILVPITSGGRPLGLLGATVIPAASHDVSFMLTAAEQAATAIEAVRQREEARTWRQRLDAVFERMAEAVLVYDREGRLVLMNAAADELLGWRGVRVGDSIADLAARAGLMEPGGQPFAPEQTGASRALRGERMDNLEEDLPTPSGTRRHLLTSAVPLRSDDRIEGAVVVYRDITYIRELERLRAEFLSMVSHELRSPLTVVLGYAQLLERQAARGEPPEDLVKSLNIIAEQSRRVNDLVEDLLDASRAEVGRLTLSLSQIELAEFIRNTVTETAALTPDHRFLVELPETPVVVRADPGRIEQVLRNLLSNAAKYSPAGTDITTRLTLEPRQAIVSITDQGTGIAREDIATLFLPFHRVRQARGREVKGVGLGLFISRSIVQAHGGEMWVQSEPGEGSTFFFSLPLP